MMPQPQSIIRIGVPAVVVGAAVAWQSTRPAADLTEATGEELQQARAVPLGGAMPGAVTRPELPDPAAANDLQWRLQPDMPVNQCVQQLGAPERAWLRADGWIPARWPEACSAITLDFSNARAFERAQEQARDKLARMAAVDTSKHSSWNMGTYQANWRAAQELANRTDVPQPTWTIDPSALADSEMAGPRAAREHHELVSMLAGEDSAHSAVLALRWNELTLFFDCHLRLRHAFRQSSLPG